jgi:hypothetical protein
MVGNTIDASKRAPGGEWVHSVQDVGATAGKKTAAKADPKTVVADHPDDRKGTLKSIGGSLSDCWNNTLAGQA